MLSIGGSHSGSQCVSPHVGRRGSVLRPLASIPSAELTLYPASRTCVRLAANGLPVRGGAVLPLLTAGNVSVITSWSAQLESFHDGRSVMPMSGCVLKVPDTPLGDNGD